MNFTCVALDQHFRDARRHAGVGVHAVGTATPLLAEVRFQRIEHKAPQFSVGFFAVQQPRPEIKHPSPAPDDLARAGPFSCSMLQTILQRLSDRPSQLGRSVHRNSGAGVHTVEVREMAVARIGFFVLAVPLQQPSIRTDFGQRQFVEVLLC